MTVILDRNGNQIQVGDRVVEWPPETVGTIDGPAAEVGTVIDLTDPDGDVNSYGRPVALGPYVIVNYDNGTTERWTALWNATGPWDDYRDDYTCDDVEVAR